jgi:N-acetylglutamate synthase-like GNAT family acetyltransferase
VHPAMGRRGLGRLLLQHVLQRARAEGVRHVAAWATPFSRPLFAAAGLPLQEVVRAPFNGEVFERYRMAGPGLAAPDPG